MPLSTPLRSSFYGSMLALSLLTSACANESALDANATEDAQATSQETHTHEDGEAHAEHADDPNAPVNPLLKDIKYVTTVAPTDHVIGDVTAPVSVIAYASVTCPHCGDWFTNDWPKFKSELVDTGKVRFVFREYPTQPAQLAMAGFLIANCADESRFFESIVYQMQNQDAIFKAAESGKARETYVNMALQFGLADEAAMETCLSDQAEIDKISLAVARAEAGDISGVPAFFIDETLYKGNTSYDTLKAAIDAEMATGITKMEK